MCHERGREKMSHPDPRQPAEANGAYPYGQPVHDSAITGTGTGMPDTDTRQYEEWHHADTPPRGAGGWDAMQEFGPPPGWADEGRTGGFREVEAEVRADGLAGGRLLLLLLRAAVGRLKAAGCRPSRPSPR